MTSRLRDFVKMSPPIFLGYKMGKDPKEILDGAYKVLRSMGVTSMEKSELALYELRELSRVWCIKWKDNGPFESDYIEWEEFKEYFLGKFFPRERR